MKKESLFGGILKYSVSTWANLVVGFLSVVITTRLLAPDAYGLISLFYSAASVLIYILSLGMDGALIRFYNEPPGNDTKEQLLYKNIAIGTIICLLGGIICTFVFGSQISEYVFGICSRILIGMLFLYVFCQILLRYLNISFRMSFEARKYTIQNILINCLSRVLVIIAAFFTKGLIHIVAILTIGLSLVMVLYLFFQRKEYTPVTRKNTVSYSLCLHGYSSYFRFALFSAPAYIVTYLNGYLGQQIICSKLGAFSLGIFSSTAMFVHILSAVKGGFTTYWSAYVYKNYRTDQGRIITMHDYVMLASILLISFLIITRDFIYLFIGQQFHDSKAFFSLILILPILSFVMETTDKGIALNKKNEINLITHTISVIVNIVLCFVLLQYLGLIGAAYANALSGIILFILNTYWGQKYYKSILSYKKSFFGLVFLLTILIIPSLFNDMMYIGIIVIIINTITCLVYRKELKYIVEHIKIIIK